MITLHNLGGDTLTALVDGVPIWPKAVPHVPTFSTAFQAKQPPGFPHISLPTKVFQLFLDWSARINLALNLTAMNIKAHSWKHLSFFQWLISPFPPLLLLLNSLLLLCKVICAIVFGEYR